MDHNYFINKKLFFLKTIFTLFSIGGIIGFIAVGSAHAFTPDYNPSNLIDNPTFSNNDSMSMQDIQSFLSNIGSSLATYSTVEVCDATIASYYSHCGQNVTAAQIIYDAGKAYGINPRVILSTLQKEQSLVTDPNPAQSQINCAMGYNSCINYVGFFTQVDNGTWILAYNYQASLGTKNWLKWSPSLSYPCSSAKTGFYSNGLYAGNSVTFVDSGGTAETITIANAATASLYCYTPYVGPLSITGYSGSYNFVYYYQLWFGATQASSPYSWSYENQSAYSDVTTNMPLTGVPTVAPGGKIYLRLRARNVGLNTWSQSSLHLGTSNPYDRKSIFYDAGWLNPERPAAMQENSVLPGQTATFNFTIDAPTQTGSYTEYFNLVDDGVVWLNNPGLFYNINVVSPIAAINSYNTTMTPGKILAAGDYLLSPDTQSVLVLQQNGNLVLYGNFQEVWSTGTTGYSGDKLIMQTDGNLVLYDKNMNALWNTGTATTNTVNNNNAWLNLQPDGNLVLYNQAADRVLWNTGTVDNPSNLSYVNNALYGGSFMFPGQYLFTANRQYRLALQTDGNLVLYNNSMKPIWNTGTAGKGVKFLALQTDGNLVLYNNSMKPIWNTGTTNNTGDYLAIQPDGNLVLYNHTSSPLWNSGSFNIR